MKILILKSYGIGNAIMASPMIRALGDAGHDVYLLSDSGPLGGPVKALFDGWKYLTEIKEFDRRKEKDGNDIVRWVVEHKFDKVIISFPYDGYFSWLFPYISCELRKPLSISSAWDKHEVEYNLDLIRDFVPAQFISPLYYLPRRKFDWITEKLARPANGLTIGICPSFKREGMWWKKHWGTENYAELIKLFPDGFKFVLLDGIDGVDVCNKIKYLCWDRASKDIVNLAGLTNIQETVAALDLCDMVIANDSGPAHIAAALQKPLIVFFGPTSDVKNKPVSPETLVLKVNKCPFILPCQGTSFWNKCTNPVCLTAMKPADVFNVIRANFLQEVNQ